MSAIKKSQINLYNQADLDNKVSFNFKFMKRIFWVVFLGAILWNVYLIAHLYVAKKSEAQAFVTQQQSYNELIRYQQSYPNKQTSLNLTNQLEKSQSIYEQKKQVLDELSFSENTSFDGFYLYLEGLSNADVDQLWLTSFSFENAMQTMHITGVAKQASSVTAYLKSLQNTVFSGTTFNDISIVPFSETLNAIKFEISTNEIITQPEKTVTQSTTQIVGKNKWSSLDENSQRAEQLSNSLIGGSND